MLFTKELNQNFRLSNPIKSIAVVLDKLWIKIDDKIAIYNIDSIRYFF